MNKKIMFGAVMEFVGVLAGLWILGLVFCLLHFVAGGAGDDAMSAHYREAIGFIINLF